MVELLFWLSQHQSGTGSFSNLMCDSKTHDLDRGGWHSCRLIQVQLHVGRNQVVAVVDSCMALEQANPRPFSG